MKATPATSLELTLTVRQSCFLSREVPSHIRAGYLRASESRYLREFKSNLEQRINKMAIPGEQIILVDSGGNPVELDDLIERLRGQTERILADDEVGLVLYVGGLGIYNLKPLDSGEFLAQPVTEISRPRFSTHVLRKQIGATVLSVTSDAIFVVKKWEYTKKGQSRET